MVADGMGGHNAGEIASEKSLEYCCGFILEASNMPLVAPEDFKALLVEAVIQANKDVYAHSQLKFEFMGMGTTFSACTVVGETLVVAHIGDSRIYTIASGCITQITTDHTYVAEMVQAGSLSKADAKTHPKRNQLTRVLGCEVPIQVDGSLHSLKVVDSVLLCSDGLTDMLTDEEIMNIVNQDASPQSRAQALINAANSNGGIDNISAIIIDVKGETN